MRAIHLAAFGGTFILGLAASPMLQHALTAAHAEAAPLQPMIIDLTSLKHGDLPKTGNPEMNIRMLLVSESGTVHVQSGNVAKHMHPKTDEIQYIVEGSGSMWLGDERKEFKPGTLIIIPKGTAHGGTIVTSGPVKALAVKLPPQPAGDAVFLKD